MSPEPGEGSCGCLQWIFLELENIELWQCGDSWQDREGMVFSFGGLTVALWVSDRPRQNPQPWPVILLGLPLGTVRGLAQKL